MTGLTVNWNKSEFLWINYAKKEKVRKKDRSESKLNTIKYLGITITGT